MSQINVTTIRNRTGGAPNLDQGIVVGAAATFSGNVSIGGTLTYEDVTNVDSVGIITARSGIEVTGGNLIVGSGVTAYAASGIVSATRFNGPTNVPAGQTGAVALAASDAGKHVAATGGVSLALNIFAVGDAVTIWNNSAGNITITLSAVTCYNATDGSTGDRTLGTRGLATLLCVAANTYVISGSGLT